MFKVGIFIPVNVLGFTTVSLQKFNVKRHFTTAHPKHAEMSMYEKKREVSRLCASLERQSMMFIKKSTECAVGYDNFVTLYPHIMFCGVFMNRSRKHKNFFFLLRKLHPPS